MPLSLEDKKKLAKRLEAGEDVPITFGGEGMVTGLSGGRSGEGVSVGEDDHLRTDVRIDTMREGGSMEQTQEVDANLVIQALQQRIGQLVANYETELAVRDAIIQQQRAAAHTHDEAEE